MARGRVPQNSPPSLRRGRFAGVSTAIAAASVAQVTAYSAGLAPPNRGFDECKKSAIRSRLSPNAVSAALRNVSAISVADAPA